MTLPDYQIYVISAVTGQVVKFYDATAWYMMRYSRALNDVGRVILTVPATDELDSIFTLDNFIEVSRTHPVSGRIEKEETYFVRLTHRYQVENDERYTVGGVSLNHLLQRRIIDPDDDPLAAGGYSTKSGAADVVMRDYVREQAADLASVSRQFPNFTVPNVEGAGLAVGERLRHERLLDILKKLGLSGDIDFLIERVTGNNLELRLAPFGRDKTQTSNFPGNPFVRLTPQRGNLQNPSLEVDRNEEANAVYVRGQGQGTSQIVYKQFSDTVYDSPFNRIEVVTDARNIEKGDTLGLFTSADAELKKNAKKTKFDFEPVIGSEGNVYRLDWDIADYITVAWGSYSEDVRIMGVEIQVDSNGEAFTLKTEPRALL